MGADACGCLEKSSQLEMSCIQKERSSLVSGSRLDHSARVAYHKKREDAKCVFCPWQSVMSFMSHCLSQAHRGPIQAEAKDPLGTKAQLTHGVFYFGLHFEFILGFIVSSNGQDRAWHGNTRKYTERKWYKPHIVASYYSTRMRQSGSCFVQPNPVRHTLIISHFNSTTLLPDRTSIQPLFNYLLPSHTSIQPHFNHSARTSTEPPFSQSSRCLTLQFNHTSIISHFNFSLTTLNHLTLLSSHTLVQAHFYHLTLKFNPTSIISSYLTLQLNPTSIISSHLTL